MKWQLLSIAIAGFFLAPTALAGPPRIKADIKALKSAVLDVKAEFNNLQALKHRRIHSSLLEVIRAQRDKGQFRGLATSRGLMMSGDSVLVEIRLDPKRADGIASDIKAEQGSIRHHSVPGLMEVWVPVDRIERIASYPGVHRIMQARLVKQNVGNSTSQGVAASNADFYYGYGADGTGVVLANIDAGFTGYTSRQATGDWPSGSQLIRYEVSGGTVTTCGTCSSFATGSIHGTATVEINFDMAPGADYRVYKASTSGDMYSAMVHAADNGADVISCSLGPFLDGIGDGSTCPPIWSAPCGTVSEAAAYARSNNTLPVFAAGNSREEHWGGLFDELGTTGTLDWGAGGNVNMSIYCHPRKSSFIIELFWDDWTDPVDHDYDIGLYECNRQDVWESRASSVYEQDGSPGADPQEFISYTATSVSSGCGCPNKYGAFAIAVFEYSAASDRNLQVFANGFGELDIPVYARSIGFPNDSPDVFAVSAIDVGTEAQESYSAEGPILGPGGTLGAPAYDKPDCVSFAGVDTEAYGAGAFAGTSASTPHVAGVAALLMQLRNEKSSDQDGDVMDMMRDIGLYGGVPGDYNDLGSGGFDTQYGFGRIKLDICDESRSLTAGLWTMFSLPCNPRGLSTVENVLADEITGEFGTDWEVFSRDAAAEAYVPLALDSSLEPGVGYWIQTNSDVTINVQGLVTDRSEYYPVPLFGTAGLGRPNLVGSPHAFDVAWPDVMVYYEGAEHTFDDAVIDSKIRSIIWTSYDGSGYTEHDGSAPFRDGTMSKFDGFWVKALTDVVLLIPNAASGSKRKEVSSSGGWTVELGAHAHGLAARARLGQLEDSSNGYDKHDVELFRGFGDTTLDVVFPHPDWMEYAEDYVRDYRAPRTYDRWRFEVRSNQAGRVTLRWNGPREVLDRAVLYDVAARRTIRLQGFNSSYSFEMRKGSREFVFTLGSFSIRERRLRR